MPNSTEDALALFFEEAVRVLGHVRGGIGLSRTAASTLARVCAEGPLRLTDLSGREGVSQPSMTQLVGRLERGGLVRRSPSSDDGRVVLVEPTPAGRELLMQRRASRAVAMGALFDRLSPPEQDAIRAALPALQHMVDLAIEPRPGSPSDPG